LSLANQTLLRYGENPHQRAVWAGPQEKPWRLIQGKELSYNNLLDTEAAFWMSSEFDMTCVTIVKHNNPCGVAIGSGKLADIFSRALACDSKSAFGGIVAVNTVVDADAAKLMTDMFLEVVIANSFTKEALTFFSKKKNLRVIEWPLPEAPSYEVRKALGGWLVQQVDAPAEPDKFETVTKTQVLDSAKADLQFAWKVAKHVRSNAIVLAKDQATVGIGAGQMSRVDAVEIALIKSSITDGCVLASDAFFPFRDNIEMLKGKGIVAIIQPGGSKRDGEVIQACNELGIAMVFTGQRHFRH